VSDEAITSLEMTSPNQLVVGRPPSRPLVMEELDPRAAPLLRSTYVRVFEHLASGGRIDWSAEQWHDELSRPGVTAWVGRVDEEVAGLLELDVEPDGEVGIVVFGLVAEFVGRGFGGAFLTLATELAWGMRSPHHLPTRRVWVETSSRDHPHARPNYERRGFRAFQTRRSHAETPGTKT